MVKVLWRIDRQIGQEEFWGGKDVKNGAYRFLLESFLSTGPTQRRVR
jgi:hypothetical protein